MKATFSGFLAAAALCGLTGCQDQAKKGGVPNKAETPAKIEADDQVVLHVEGMF
ncbi:MAG: hypothetical protein K2X38_09640 [Gemmataceae bacterium]|nr:hypothetical protein [Gemmataceae bacterium]